MKFHTTKLLRKFETFPGEHVRSICAACDAGVGEREAICYHRDNNEDVNAQFYALEGDCCKDYIKGFQNLWGNFHLAADFDTYSVRWRVVVTKMLAKKGE